MHLSAVLQLQKQLSPGDSQEKTCLMFTLYILRIVEDCFTIGSVDCFEVVDVGHHDRRLHNLLIGRARRRQHRAHVLHRLFSLRRRVILGHKRRFIHLQSDIVSQAQTRQNVLLEGFPVGQKRTPLYLF